MKVVVGDLWKLQYNLLQVGWHYTLVDKLSTSQLDEIAKHLIQDVKSIPPNAVDPYDFGKQLGRMARLALIADNLGIADARQQAVATIESSILPWLQGNNVNAFLYDRTYGGVITTNGLADQFSDFGSGWYSDHHFHYGYFLHAAAVLARFDGQFFESNKPAFDSLLRDICNPDSTDVDFPVARHKDFFDGHSWASGLFTQSNGKGQESSSEVCVDVFLKVKYFFFLFIY
jgi:endo-1,3(4)-beta-glucanase